MIIVKVEIKALLLPTATLSRPPMLTPHIHITGPIGNQRSLPVALMIMIVPRPHCLSVSWIRETQCFYIGIQLYFISWIWRASLKKAHQSHCNGFQHLMDCKIDQVRTSCQYISMNIWRQILLQPGESRTLRACSVTWPAIRTRLLITVQILRLLTFRFVFGTRLLLRDEWPMILRML